MSSLDTSRLNKEQLQAVVHSPHIPLQILAGPGSGKTKVLTSRIAYLIEHYGLKPSEICAVTFTNKAANEMKERLEKLIGKQKSTQLTMGTFHAICAKFLHEYGPSIGLSKNFTICDPETSKRLIAKIIKDYSSDHRFREVTVKDSEIVFQISQSKVKGLLPSDLLNPKVNPKQQLMAMIYREYSASLKQINSLDFDDILLFATRLFSKEAKCVTWCKHVLVDEFQDTNFIQYKLLAQLSSVNAGITIVGDPDQSIYGWRSADVTNLHRMKKDFPNTLQIFLEENYRSTMPILRFSLAIISQDKTRISKTLRTSLPHGTPPLLQRFASETEEAQFIAREIKRLSVHYCGSFRWDDFVILLRFNALSRSLETALQKEGIPYRMLAGVKFFDRLEIKDLTAYLQLIDNPSYFPAFQRVCQTPPKGIGEKSLERLLSKATTTNQAVMNLAISIALGKIPDFKPPLKENLLPLTTLFQKLRTMAEQGKSVSSIIQDLISSINYEERLKKNKDWETRWENVKELINYANQFEEQDLESQFYSASPSQTPLRKFLHESMLSTHGKDDVGDQTEMVTIATCHSAKGLEWPVVFIPAVERNIFPFYRSENEEEERRLLYVACTRAQSLLYLTYSMSRMVGERISNGISPFLSKVDESLISSCLPTISKDDRETEGLVDSSNITSFLKQNLSTSQDPSAPIPGDKLFRTAKKILYEKSDASLLTPVTRDLDMPTATGSGRLESKHSSNDTIKDTAKDKSRPLTEMQLSRGNKRLGMGRLTLGYCPNKKAKLS